MRQVRMLIGDVVLRAELLATPTADAIWEALPVESRASTWGDEVYFQTTLDLEGEEDARTVLELGEIAFWLAGNCIAICFGPTPVSHGDEPRLASPGNVWATSLDDVGLLAERRRRRRHPGRGYRMTEARNIDRQAVAADWRARGYSCHHMVDPPGQRWRDFVHAENELLVVVEGRLELEVEGETRTVGPGMEVFIPARARHTVVNVNEGPTEWLFGYD